MNPQELTGRCAIVTGGTKGIGKGIATSLAQSGAKVLIVGRDLANAESVCEQLSHEGLQVWPCAADVTQPNDLEHMVQSAREYLGGIDIVCCNAGIFPQSTLAEMTLLELERVIGVNLLGTMLTVKASLSDLRKSTSGRVIITSSITGPLTGMSGFTHYAASKAGQLGFMRAAAVEFAAARITVNAVLPGNIITEGFEDLGEDYRRSMERSIPVGRLGTVDDIGKAVIFLASPESSFITGHALVIDGGQTLPESL